LSACKVMVIITIFELNSPSETFMKRILIFSSIFLLSLCVNAQNIEWAETSEASQWQLRKGLSWTKNAGDADVTVHLDQKHQVIEGFGACFNELGWTSLNYLQVDDRESIMRELFAPGVGANFTICRMPIGANDFSRKWYSYNETEGDFEMNHFAIDNDFETLIPFIKNAQKYNPNLSLWASPWSPPSWMKYNKHYAARSVLGTSTFKSDKWGMDLTGINNGLPPEKEGKEGTDMFIQEEQYFKAYTLYFSKFIEAYRREGINIGMVMPQNEFNSAQVFPSCTWTAAGLNKFVSYLGPEMGQLDIDVFFGTVERANEKLVDTLLTDPIGSKYIKGVGFQWAGKDAIAGIHQRYPDLTLYQTEQECGNSKNDWEYFVYAWDLMKLYLNNGANAYMYWNISLQQGGISTWGWKQNSLISVNTQEKTFTYNYEFYLMKHLSHYVQPGAKKVSAIGEFGNLIAFLNPDNTVAILLFNDSTKAMELSININDKTIAPTLQPNSLSTILVSL
jgi:glucosylceramidase